MRSIEAIVRDFVCRFTLLLVSKTMLQVSESLRPIGDLSAKKVRKPMPKQFCPVPGCKGVAAPIFGMVCRQHKDVAKSKIVKYRAARKLVKKAISKRGVKKTSNQERFNQFHIDNPWNKV